jgi:hypothetical protein
MRFSVVSIVKRGAAIITYFGLFLKFYPFSFYNNNNNKRNNNSKETGEVGKVGRERISNMYKIKLQF